MSVFARLFLTTITALALTACTTPGGYQDGEYNPKAAELNIKLGLSYLQQGKFDLANSKLNRALSQAPDSGQAHWAFALLQEQLGKPDVAREHYEDAIRLESDSSEILNSYGAFLCKQGQPARAYEMFNTAAANRLYGTPESALTNAGICAARQKDAVKAENYFRQALAKNSQYSSALYQMALLMFQEGKYLASRGYRQRLESVLIQDDPKVLSLCARTEQRLNNPTDAARCARQLKLEFPSSSEAKAIY